MRRNLVLDPTDWSVGARWSAAHRAASSLSSEELADLGREWATRKIIGYIKAEIDVAGPLNDAHRAKIVEALNDG